MNLDFEQSLSIVVEFRASSETHKDKGAAPAGSKSCDIPPTDVTDGSRDLIR